MRKQDNNDIPVAIDAKKLCFHTVKVTNNLNNFPKKYRFTLVDRIVRLSFDVYDAIIDANETRGVERVEHISKGIRDCRKMKFYLELTLNLLSPECSITHWTSLVDKVETQLEKWRKSTK